MQLSPRLRLALAGSALVITGAALAVPWYSSRTLAAELQELAATHAQGDLRIRNLAHDAGWLHSAGSLDVEWRNQCAGDPEGPTVVHVEYSAQHLPDIQGLTRFAWSATPAGPATVGVQQLLQGGKLTGSGRAGYDGTLSTDMALPELAITADGQKLQITPSQGRLVLGKTALRLDWAVERMALRGKGLALEAKQIRMEADLKDRMRGTGRMALDVDSMSTADMLLQGLRWSSETTERADRLDSRMTESVRSAQFMGQNLKDLVLEAEVKGLHTASVQAISKVFGDSCGMQNTTAEEKLVLRNALKKLLASGLSVGIPTLQGSAQGGGLNAALQVTLAPAPGGAVLLASQLSSSGHIQIKGGLMPPDQKAFALSTGYVNEIPDGVQAAFEYGGGVLKVSGKTLDAAMVQLGLQKLDGWLTAFLAGVSLALPEEEQPAVAPSEAPAAAPAAAPGS
jgi:hypothetical protein